MIGFFLLVTLAGFLFFAIAELQPSTDTLYLHAIVIR